MAESSARLSVALAGDAIVGTSDMPDTTGDRFTWEGSCWELVSDPDLDTALVRPGGSGAAQDAFAARLANILRLNVGNLVVTEGATINQLVALAIAGATAEFQQAYIQNLRSNGAIIDEAVIGDLAANIITSGLFRTADAGQRVVIDGTGIVMYGLDEGDVEYEMVRIGPAGDNLITAGDTTISPAGVQAASGDFGELTIDGESLSEYLVELPRGAIARGWNNVSGRPIGPMGRTELAEMTVPVEDGRSYRLEVEPFSVYLPRGGRLALEIYLEKGTDSAPAASPDADTSRLYRVITYRDSGGDGPMVLFNSSHYAWESEGATEWRLLFALNVYDSTDEGAVYAASETYHSGIFRAAVYDVGLHQEFTMIDRTGRTSTEPTPPKPTPPPAKKRHTKTYDATGYRVYDEDGSARTSPDVVQGLYAGGPSRFNRRGGWLFPSMTGDLAGATIEKVRVKLYCNHTHSSAGSTVNVCTWGGVMQSSLAVRQTVNGWKRNTAKWLTLPSSTHAGFKSGAIDGIGVKPTSTSSTQYARFATNAKIEITYVR